MISFYIFDDEQTAINAEQQISIKMGHPIVSVNQRTGIANPAKQKELYWEIPRQRIDGKWYVRYPPAEIVNILPSGFNEAFPHTIEEWHLSWIVQE